MIIIFFRNEILTFFSSFFFFLAVGSYGAEEGCTSTAASAMTEPAEVAVEGMIYADSDSNGDRKRACTYSCRGCPKGRYSGEEGNRMLYPVPEGWIEQKYAEDIVVIKFFERDHDKRSETWLIEGAENDKKFPWKFTHSLTKNNADNNLPDRYSDSFLDVYGQPYLEVSGPNNGDRMTDAVISEKWGWKQGENNAGGKYISGQWGGGCWACEAGQYNEQTAQTRKHDVLNAGGAIQLYGACKDCPRGRYGLMEGIQQGQYYQQFNTDEMRKHMCQGCQAGYYNGVAASISADACIACDVGKWLETSNDVAPSFNIAEINCKDCIEGRYGDQTALTFSNQALDDLGNEKHTKFCKACPSGKFSAKTGQASAFICETCGKGKFSTMTSAPSSIQCTKCPAGYFGPDLGLQQGKDGYGVCSARVGKDEVTSRSCLSSAECADGSECVRTTSLTATTACTPCDPGRFLSMQGRKKAGDCSVCPKGKYNDQSGAPNENEICMGKTCEAHCKKCPLGFYQDQEGRTLFAECKSCQAGQYGAKEAAETPEDCKDCPRGKYTDELSSTTRSVELEDCKDCPVGRYGEDNGAEDLSWCKLCLKGRYLAAEGRTSSDDCKFCPAGKYSENEPAGSPEDCKNCPTGKFGKDGGILNLFCNDLAAGPGGNDVPCITKYCGTCPDGFYTSERGRPVCYMARDGYYSLEPSGLGASDQTPCPMGWYGLASSVPRASCDACPTGKYGDELALSNSGLCDQCSKGKYSDVIGIEGDDKCKSCPKGSFGKDAGRKSPEDCTNCPKGDYQDQTGQQQCKNCPKGYSSAAQRSENCNRCDAGRYQNLPGKDDCIHCPSGQFGCTDCTDDTQHPTPHDPSKEFMILCGGPKKTAKEMADPKEICYDKAVRTPRLEFERREYCALCPSGWYTAEAQELDCERCPLGSYTGCPGYSKCLACTGGQTTYLLGSTKCVSKEMETALPAITEGSVQPMQLFELTSIVVSESGNVATVNHVETELLQMQPGETVSFQSISIHHKFDAKRWNVTSVSEKPFTSFTIAPNEQGRNPPKDGEYKSSDVENNIVYSEYHLCAEWITAESENRETKPDERDFNSYFFQVSYESTFPPEGSNMPGADTNVSICKNGRCEFEISPDLYGMGGITDFKDGKLNKDGLNRACQRTYFPLYSRVHYVRIRGYVQEAQGTPSIVTPLYAIAPSCGDLMYLCRRCFPPVGPGAWKVGGPFNPNTAEWVCQPCPNGGDCRGDKLWSEVYGKFGYMRLGVEDFEDRKVAFWPCFKQKACLGGKIDLPIGEEPGTKYAFSTGAYHRALLHWTTSINGTSDGGAEKCKDSAACAAYVNEYGSMSKPLNDYLFRPAIDCCSAIDPLKEDKKECKKNPENFQAISLQAVSTGESPVFVDNLDYDTTYADLLEAFKEFQPTTAKTASALPSEDVPVIAPLGWGTVWFATSMEALAAAESMTERNLQNASIQVIHKQWNFSVGFNPHYRSCAVDLSLADDAEQCHVELGFRRFCNGTESGKCRLCRACAKGFWAQGVSNCLTCPTKIMNAILVVMAFCAVTGMLYAFLSSALEDSGAEAGSTVIHFSQGMQKILLNHIQLISLASGFPLKWPDEVNEMFYWMGLFGNAGSYVFNPACQDIELVEGESMFFQKQLVILALPFISACACAVFWTLSAMRDYCWDPQKRWDRRMKKHNSRRAKKMRKLQRQNDKKLSKVRRARLKADKKIEKMNAKSGQMTDEEFKKMKKMQKDKETAASTKVVPVSSTSSADNLEVFASTKEQEPIKDTVDKTKLLADLALAFQKKIKSTKKVEQFFKKLDTLDDGGLSKTDFLPVVKSLMRKTSIKTTDEEFHIVWVHLTQVCGTSNEVTLPALLKWWQSGRDASLASAPLEDAKDKSSVLESNYQSTKSSSSSSSSSKTAGAKHAATLTLEDVDDATNTLELNYQKTSGKKKKRRETNAGRVERLQEEFSHLVYNPELDVEKHIEEMKSEIQDHVIVIDVMVQPLLPLGIIWETTTGGAANTLVGRHTCAVKKIRKKSQAGQTGLQVGDVLASMNGRPVINMSFADVKELFRYVIDIGETYQLVFFRKVHKFKSSVHHGVRKVAMANKDEVRTFDKFVATMVSVVYLLYATVTRGTFTIVACQRVGSRMYLQMDLDIQCWRSKHNWWVMNLFLPCLLAYVIGLPLISYLILRRRRHDLLNRFTRFRYGVLYTGYTDKCYYWEVVIATRKASVVAISVFLTGAGAQAQALCAMMVVIFALTAHLLWRPYVPVTEDHNTLFWSEFWGLQTAFATFWTGLFFFQEVAQEPSVQLAFTVEVLTVNFIFVFMAARWYFILKLMDLDDMVSTKRLQGFDEADLVFANRMKACLRKFFPEWQVVRNLWARRAWQNTIKHQILQRRAVRVFDFKNENHRHKGGREKSFILGTTESLHTNAAQRLGLVVHKRKKEGSEEKKESKGLFRRRSRRKSVTIADRKVDVHGGAEELRIHLEKESEQKKKVHKGVLAGSIAAGQLKMQTKLKSREIRDKNSTPKVKTIDYEALIDRLLLSFQSKIKSEYMLKQLFAKLDANKSGSLSEPQLLVLVKNLANNKSLTVEAPEFDVIWRHLTTECGPVTDVVMLEQLMGWHGPFSGKIPEPKISMKRGKSIFVAKPELTPELLIKELALSFRTKITSEYMLRQLFLKLDKGNDEALNKDEIILLVKNLANDKTLKLDSPQFIVMWDHLISIPQTGKVHDTGHITLAQLKKWHGAF